MTRPYTGPQICYWDLETAPAVAFYWGGGMHEQEIIKIIRPWYILCASVKWQHEKKVHTYKLTDYPNFKKNIHDDSAIVRELHGILSRASCIIAHNGQRFDERKLRARFLIHGIKPPAWPKSIDTLKIARSQFALPSNRLTDLGFILGLGGKRPTTGFPLWERCVNGDRAAFNEMGLYCGRDVELLEQVAERIVPYAKNLPDLTGVGCPSCHSMRIQQRGMASIKSRKHRFACMSCGHWFSR